MNNPVLQRLDEELKAYAEKNKFMGMLRITLRGTTLYEQSFGMANLEKGIAFDTNSRFSFYSLSKPFCTLGLLKLYDKGLVNLDAHPKTYVPEARVLDERLTIRHMLLHTSGAPEFLLCKGFKEKYKRGPASVIREHLLLLKNYPAFFAPGERGLYQNINFTLCALIIENVSGLPYPLYMQQEVFAPLGMKTAVVDDEGVRIANRVEGYELQGETLVAVGRTIDWMLGGGDIVGTLDDVYRLNIALKNKLLLKESTWDMALTSSPVSRFGMGCRALDWRGKRRVVHNGGHVGFRTLHEHIVEDDFDVILLSNTGFGNAREDIMEIIHNYFYGEDEKLNEKIEMDKGYV